MLFGGDNQGNAMLEERGEEGKHRPAIVHTWHNSSYRETDAKLRRKRDEEVRADYAAKLAPV